jgi:hypothetical protein
MGGGAVYLALFYDEKFTVRRKSKSTAFLGGWGGEQL